MVKEEFIKKVSGDYDYSLIPDNFKYKTYLDIGCSKHGIISMRADLLLNGSICRKCSDEKRSNKSKLIDKFDKLYGDKYKYDISNYKNNESKLRVTCNIHGDFYKSSISLLKGVGCVKCDGDEYISKCSLIYGDKYDYSKSIYIDSLTKILVVCKDHGDFYVAPTHHLHQNRGCKKCKFEYFSKKYTHNTEKFINDAIKINGDFYDYSKVNYINNKTKVEIICPKHGSFFQRPHEHKMYYGCAECTITRGEKKISIILKKLGIEYEYQKTFVECIYTNKLQFDFYLPDHNTCIEFDGIQHFEAVEYFGGEDNFKIRKERDIIKDKYCDNNNIYLLRIPYYVNNIENEIKSFLYD